MSETALLRLLHDVYCAADGGSRSILLQLDLSAAFDTIDMSTLLRRLRCTFGVSGPALSWIASYLVGRKQSVRVGEEQSSNTACEYGVPQGSVLGPLLFSLYMSPIARVIGSFGIEHAQYADDTQLYVALTDAKTLPNLTDCFHAVSLYSFGHGEKICYNRTESNSHFLVVPFGILHRQSGIICHKLLSLTFLSVSTRLSLV